MTGYANKCPACGFPVGVRYDRIRKANYVKEHDRIKDGLRVRCEGTGKAPVKVEK